MAPIGPAYVNGGGGYEAEYRMGCADPAPPGCLPSTWPNAARAPWSKEVGKESAVGADVVGGVSERFLRRPAICGGSEGGSDEGDPDIGGEGREAQMGTAVGSGSVRLLAKPNCSRFDL